MSTDVVEPGTVRYVRPASVEEAVEALASVPGARPIAGGTDLMVQLRLGHRQAPLVVDLSRVEELRALEDGRIGSAVTMRELLNDADTAERCPALIEAARLLGGRQIQAMATLGGNLCNASPAAESATPLLVHDATAHIFGPDGARSIPMQDFWVGPGRTALGDGELLASVTIPTSQGRSAYRRIELRRSVDIAVVNVAAFLEVADGEVVAARVAIGAAAPTPRRVPEAEAELLGQRVGGDLDKAVRRAAVLAGEAAVPIDDTRATARYRSAMIPVLAVRALEACLEAGAPS